jgi:3-(3-hydroxy-phenyl)propionate hydroxylase
VRVTIETPDGPYTLSCAWLVVCDGARSPVRHMLGLESHGQVFRDRFLIADVVMKADYPTERWFWFDPPFHPGQSVLLHRQADHVWRVDFQLGWEADPEVEKQPERVMARLKAMLGDREFELEWVSVYTFQCRRIDRFRHGRVLFAGDAAHQVSPFGARGANSGIQDADALAWRLAALVAGTAQESVLDHWAHEREHAADENILNSTRSTDFITPKSAMAHAFREATLQLAGDMPFARRLVNSGRLSTPSVVDSSPANTPGATSSSATQDATLSSAQINAPGALAFSAPAARPGAPSPDAPLRTPSGEPVWWLRCLSGDFTILMFADHETQHHLAEHGAQLRALARAQGLPAPQVHVIVPSAGHVLAAADERDDAVHCLIDQEGLLSARLDARPGTVYLLRPDQHVCARWRTWDAPAVLDALARALGQALISLDRHAA